ncbi:hypothetical protein [Ekhidna sp.]
MGLSQQRLADLMDIKRGKVAGYFYETQAKPAFHQKLSEQFDLNLGKFLTLEMSDLNFETFFNSSGSTSLSEPKVPYGNSGPIEILQKAKQATRDEERSDLIDEAIILYEKLMAKNSQLKDELIEALRQKID